jgi:succinate dehydrogenase/fumarate reductase flavoprotein subunit
MAAAPKIIVIGGGLAGLSAVIKIAEMGANVDLFSIVPVKRSHSVCAQGGINAAKNLKGEGDSTWQHFDDTVYGGDFLANQPPVKDMCEAAPGIIDLLDRMGVPFNRTPEGLLDFRRFGGTLYNRTAFAGATTGQQLLYALDEQVRRYESEGKVKKYEHWEFLCRRHHHCHRRYRRDLWEVDQFRGLHRFGAVRALPAGRFLRQRRVHSGSPYFDSGQRQTASHVGICAWRGRTRLGSEDCGG